MALTEKEFSMIKKKMDKIDQHLNELYTNWHAWNMEMQIL